MEVTFIGGMEIKPPSPGDGFDRVAALERVGGDVELLKEIARVFLDDCPRSLQELKAAATCGDCQEVERVAHGLKGAASNFGARRLVASGLAIEQMGRAKKLDDFQEALAVFEAALADLRAELENIMAG